MLCRSTEASWHADYRDTAYIYIGGLPFELSEGDIITIFSQFGEPVHVNLVRDKDTGKSKGFGFLKYEDQRSTDLAVDNLGGASVMGRVLKVDHTRYKRKDEEEIMDNAKGMGDTEGAWDSDVEHAESRRKMPRSSEAERARSSTLALKEDKNLADFGRDHDDDDPMKGYLVRQREEDIQNGLTKIDKVEHRSYSGGESRHHHRHHHRRHERHDGNKQRRHTRPGEDHRRSISRDRISDS